MFSQHNKRIAIVLDHPFGPPQGRLDPNLAAVLAGQGDFALLTRELSVADLRRYRAAHGMDPIVMPVANGSADRFGYVDPVVIIVNRANPLRRIDFRAIDAIFSSTHWRSGRAAKDWGSVGVTAWAGKPIHIAGAGAWEGTESARALTIRRKVLSVGGRAGRWVDVIHPGAEATVVADVARDRLAIGFTGAGHVQGDVRILAVSANGKTRALLPGPDAMGLGRYPLARTVDLLLATGRGGCLPPAQRLFARYLLSPAGQAVVRRNPPFLPLAPAQLHLSRRRIAALAHCPG